MRRLPEPCVYLTLAALMLVMVGAASCSSTNLAAILEAASKDPATICGAAMYAGASVTFSRTNITNGTVSCSDGKLSVQSTPPAQSVGVQLVPMQASPFGPGTPPVAR